MWLFRKSHMLTMTDVAARLTDVKVKTTEALRASEADGQASVVLVAVVREFNSKDRQGSPPSGRRVVCARRCDRAGTGRR